MKIYYFLIFVLISYQFDYAQTNKNLFDTILDDAEIFFVDGYKFYTYPLRMNSNEWITAAGTGVGTFLLINSDGFLRKRVGTNVDEYDNDFWNIFETYGVVQVAEAAGVATYAVGLLGGNNKIRKLGRMTIQSLTYSGLTAMFIRMIAGRKRPPFTDNHKEFIGFTTNNSFQSFPSGHVTVAFALSTVMAEYIDTPWSRIGFYSMAGLAAVERIINDQHWITDVALGALVGVAGAIHVLNEESKRDSNIKSKLSIIPSFNGITLRYSLN